MALEAYAPCPCGSGKKFKWCCQPIAAQIERAFEQESQGQHETALRIMDEVIAQNPTNPEPLGRKAQLLYENHRLEEAEATLQKALDISPKYPFGYLLRGVFRQNEGEIPGALMLFRKAAEYYDPEARDVLGQVYARIGENELKMNRPVAARAALQIASRFLPADESLRQSFDAIFGDQSALPASARREYTFRGLPPDAAAPRRQAWDRALAEAGSGRLGEAVTAFDGLTQDDPENAPAWYNLGISWAWLGDNRGALEALDRYINLEADEARAVEATTLTEVLRCGFGMEAEANYLEHAYLYQIRDGNALVNQLQTWEQQGRLAGVQSVEEQSLIRGMILEQKASLTPELAATQLTEVGAYFLILPGFLRLWNTNVDAVDKVRGEVQQRIGPAVSEPRVERRAPDFGEITTEAIAIPSRQLSQEDAIRRIQEHVERFFEETWIHRPLRSLGMAPPIDAAGSTVLRKKVLGAVQFLQDCAAFGITSTYDFDRLRRKLGLLAGGAAQAAGPAETGPDVSAMSAAELAALAPDSLDFGKLEQAYQAALKLDAREIAARFAKALVAQPAEAGRPDRFPWYAHLVQTALAGGDTGAALDYVNEGERVDCEHNEGRRRNEYELRRGQIHAKRGETGEARRVFESLIERVPGELKYRGSAAEAMLAAKDLLLALRFAEGGLAKARQQNDRDSEGYFMELVEAANRQKKE
jgi:tetratricopeptide (TPR) repeat protein